MQQQYFRIYVNQITSATFLPVSFSPLALVESFIKYVKIRDEKLLMYICYDMT